MRKYLFLTILSLFIFIPTVVQGATEFISTIQQTGGDYSTLSSWEAAVQSDLTATTTRVFSGTGTGQLSNGDTVTCTSAGIHNDTWENGSNIWTVSGTGSELGDTAIAIAKIDGAWSNPDQTAVTITGWSTSATNYIRIYTTATARHNGKWDDTKYGLEVTNPDNGAIHNNESYTQIIGLQIDVQGGWSDNEGIITNSGTVSHCIVRQSGTGHSATGIVLDSATVNVYNNIVYDFSEYGIHHATFSASKNYIYNNTVHNCAYGIRNGGTAPYAKNNIVQDCGTNCFQDSFDNASTNNLSDDATYASSTADIINTEVSFVDEANDDFHLAGSDTAARDAGVDLSGDSNLAFDDDIDGEKRPAGQAWDIGADERKRATIIKKSSSKPHYDYGVEIDLDHPLADGLVGAWIMNEGSGTTIHDLTGNSSFDSASGTPEFVSSKAGIGLYTSNTDTECVKVELGNNPDWDSPYTIVFGFVPSTTLDNVFNPDYLIGTNSVGGEIWEGPMNLGITDAGKIDLWYRSTAGWDENVIDAKTSWAADEFFQVAYSNDFSEVKGYVDGVYQQTFTPAAPLYDASNDLLGIGNRPEGGTVSSDLINIYLFIYDRVLTASEIAWIYNEPYVMFKNKTIINAPLTNFMTGGLVGHWTFNGQDMDWASTTAEALDRSGNSNNGNVVNGATPVIGISGQGLEFDGVDDYVDASNVYDGVKTVAFWIKADGTADPEYFDGQLDEVRFYSQALNSDQIGQLYRAGARTMKFGAYSSSPLSSAAPSSKIIDLNGTANIEVSSGTITANSFIDSTIYVDGSAASTIDSDWRFVAITTNTGIDASAVDIGKVASAAWACGDTLTHCGDNYTTVQMTETYGSQCWLGENLRTIYKPDCETSITRYCYDDANGCNSPWGGLYDWDTMMNGATTATNCGAKIQGICPSGWHIPSDYASCSSDDFPGLGTDGGALKDTGIEPPWTSPNTDATNASNWTGYPAGWYSGGSYSNRANYGRFWSSAQSDANNALSHMLYYDSAAFDQYANAKASGFSVRCVKD